ncbi:MAG: segregation and condensation protein A [Nitrospirota bacterium]
MLHLIKKNEINIYNIPIVLIIEQYSEYIELMKSLNLNIAGEFIMMLGTLIYIKSRMLLPPDESEEDEEENDPRLDLVRHLLEYKRFKDAGEDLAARESLWREIYQRKEKIELDEEDENNDEIYYDDLTLFDLLDALRKLLENIPDKRSIEINVESLSVKEKIAFIIDRLESDRDITFISLFDKEKTRMAIIITFLALLELIKLKIVRITQIEEFGQIRIYKV